MLNNKISIAVLVSGNGSNLQALLDAQKNGKLKNGIIRVVISDRQDAYALERARAVGVPAFAVDRRHQMPSRLEWEIRNILEKYDVDLIVLAGFLTVLSNNFVDRYKNRIINIHPSLLPAFGGRGFYGLKVHEEALKQRVKITGATVHYVTKEVDGGEIIMQKAVRVLKDDTPETLQQRVLTKAEHAILPKAVDQISAKILKEKKNARIEQVSQC